MFAIGIAYALAGAAVDCGHAGSVTRGACADAVNAIAPATAPPAADPRIAFIMVVIPLLGDLYQSGAMPRALDVSSFLRVITRRVFDKQMGRPPGAIHGGHWNEGGVGGVGGGWWGWWGWWAGK